MSLQNYTYECVKTNFHFKAGEVAIIYPTFVPFEFTVYQWVSNKGELMDTEYLNEHYKKIEV